jgi:hypothetical protein
MGKNFIQTFALVAVIVFFSSWGFLVHRTINQLAIYELPKSMQSFFYTNRDNLAKNSIRPDLRRNEDSTEAPKHFIDLEIFGDPASLQMPMKWDDAVRQYGKDSLIKYGYVPYYIIVVKNRLTNAFRLGNKDSILFYAADLGHYIGDANVPLHSSVNYDGQLSNQKGLHSLWEATIPEAELDQYTLHSRHKASYLSSPEEAIWNAIRHAHSLLKDIFAQEKEATKSFTDSTKFKVQMRNGRESRSFTPAFAKAYSERLGKTINEQLLNSANLIADFWYTAWVDADKPDLSSLLAKPFEKKDKKAMKMEFKAYRKGKLIEKKLLFARQISGNSGQ